MAKQENKLYSLNKKGTNFSLGVVTREIVTMLTLTGLANHLDIKEVFGTLGSATGHLSGNRGSISYIAVKTDKDSFTGETMIIRDWASDILRLSDIENILSEKK